MRAQWDSAAAGWNAHSADIRAWLHGPTELMGRLAGVEAGSRVLDVAAGAGDQTLSVAQAVGARGYVLATDLSPALVALARDNAVRAGFAHVETRVADGERLGESLGEGVGEGLGVPAASFDAAVCRLGLMFFPDPLQGLREMHRALRPGGRVCTVVFSGPQHNPCVAILLATALRHARLPPRDPFAPGSLFSLGRPGHIDTLFHEAGFCEVATTVMAAPFLMPSVDHYIAFVRSSASPVLQILAGCGEATADAAWADIRQQLRAFDTATGWAGPNELLITAARRP